MAKIPRPCQPCLKVRRWRRGGEYCVARCAGAARVCILIPRREFCRGWRDGGRYSEGGAWCPARLPEEGTR